MRSTSRSIARVVAVLGALTLGLSLLASPPATAVGTTAYVVQVAPGVDVDAALRPTVTALGGTVDRTFTDAIRGAAIHLPSTAVSRLLAVPGVASVELDRAVSIDQSNPPWGLDRIDQRSLPLSKTYTYRYTGYGVDAYVIDTGIRLGHRDFAGRILSGTDVIDGGTAEDCNGHGTHVAGTLGGTTYGVAKRVRVVAVRVLNCKGQGTDTSVIAGINWVIRSHTTNPAVANFSLSGEPSSALDTAINNLIKDGVTVTLAAGNDSDDACAYSPGRTAAGITVAASDQKDALASYSNRGTCVDLIAPGSSIVSDGYTSTTATATMSGTSMASPHVAGAAARYLQAHPTAKPSTVASALTGSATTGKVTGAGRSCVALVLSCIPATANRLLYVAPTS